VYEDPIRKTALDSWIREKEKRQPKRKEMAKGQGRGKGEDSKPNE
jgi:hypothetical protein